MTSSDLSPVLAKEHISRLQQWFERFSEQARDSKMYALLSKKISEDPDLLAKIPDNKTQPVPNLFLTSVNYLLGKNLDDELSGFYPNYAGSESFAQMYPSFRKFCFSKTKEIESLMDARLGQTNEVRRCALLLPAVSVVAARANTSSIHLID